MRFALAHCYLLMAIIYLAKHEIRGYSGPAVTGRDGAKAFLPVSFCGPACVSLAPLFSRCHPWTPRGCDEQHYRIAQTRSSPELPALVTVSSQSFLYRFNACTTVP